MPTWWGKSSSKETRKKAGKESIIDTLHRKFKFPSEGKLSTRSGGSRRRSNDTISEKGDRSPSESRSPSPSKVARCQSFAERPHAQPLPLPGLHPSSVGRVDSEISISAKSRLEKSSKSLLFLPLPKPACIRCGSNPADLDGDMVNTSVFSDCSADSDEPADSRNRSPLATDSETGTRTAAGSPSSLMLKDQPSAVAQLNSREVKTPTNILSNHTPSTSPKRRPLRHHVPNLQVPPHGVFYSGPDSSLSSPSRSPLRAFGTDQVLNSAFWAGKPYPEINFVGSGHCSSPGSGHNSGHNSMGGDMSGPLFWQPSRGSPEYSPVPSPRMTSPGPSSRIQSGAVTPIHPRAAGTPTESQTGWVDEGKQQSHRLPLPPLTVTNTSPFSHSNSAATSPSMPRSPARADSPMSSGSRWKKGKLLGRGTFGHVYIGFNSESGEMCAMKEVTMFSDDAKSMESAKQLMQEIHLLSRLRHPNIVQYYGSEKVDDKLYIYLEYVSGGSIHKLLQEYGQFGELAIRSYTQQILSGLAYLHAKNTLHRDIKGANILVDPNGRVKVAVQAQGILARLNHQLSPIGKPFHRAAFYTKEALQLMLHSNSNNLNAFSPINFIFKIGAYKSFSEISPVLQFANFTCNQALIEALERFDRIHVIDFDIGFGVQWSSFMQELVLRGNGTPSLKITAVVSPSSCNEIELNFTRENLSQYAKDLNMPFEFNALHIESLSSPSFPLPGHLFDNNEAVGVNFPVSSFINHPSCFPLALHFLKQLRPKVIVTLDKNSDRIDAPLPANVVHTLQSYSSLLESLDAVNVNLDVLQKIERHFIQPTINKIVLGHNNRSPDKLPPWRNMFLQSGFSPFTFSNFTEAQAECLVQRAPVRGFQVERKPSSLVLCWQRKELISISTWRC